MSDKPAGRAETIVSASLGLILGATVWIAGTTAAGGREPWDASGSYYYAALLVAGLVSHLLYPKAIYLMGAGIFLGQCIALAIVPGLGPLFLVGVVFLVFYSSAAWIGIWIAKSIRTALS